ncbi:hypothetical protein INR49_010490, partial [Caranx melampygus]
MVLHVRSCHQRRRVRMIMMMVMVQQMFSTTDSSGLPQPAPALNSVTSCSTSSAPSGALKSSQFEGAAPPPLLPSLPLSHPLPSPPSSPCPLNDCPYGAPGGQAVVQRADIGHRCRYLGHMTAVTQPCRGCNIFGKTRLVTERTRFEGGVTIR